MLGAIIVNMWKQWVNGILGVFIILMPSIGLTAGIQNILAVIFGIIIAVLAFWTISEAKKWRGNF